MILQGVDLCCRNIKGFRNLRSLYLSPYEVKAEDCHKSEASMGDTVTVLGQPGLQNKKLSNPPTPNLKDLAYI